MSRRVSPTSAPPVPAVPPTGRDACRVLNQVWDRLDRNPAPELLAAAVRNLVELGLGGPARELLLEAPAGDAQVAALRQLVRCVPTGRVPWEDLAPTFEVNLTALMDGRPELRELEASVRGSLPRHQLFRSRDGHLHLSQREPRRMRRWIPALMDDPELTGLTLPIDATSPPAAIIGLCLNRLVELVHALTGSEQHGRVPVLLLEPDLSRLAAWLHAADRTKLLRDPRVLVFAGPHAVEQYRGFLGDNDDVPPAGLYLNQHTPGIPAETLQEVKTRIDAERSGRYRRQAAELAERCRRRDEANGPAPIGAGARVLGFTSRFTTMVQYSMRDIGHAFESLGCTFRLEMEADEYRAMTTLTTIGAVLDFDPDLVVLINHFRLEQPGSLATVPVLTWVQDPTDTVLSAGTGAALGPRDFVCGYYRGRCVEDFGYPAERFFSTPLPVSDRLFHDAPAPAPAAGELACDLMYVGHLHEDLDAHRASWRAQVPPAAHPLLDAIDAEVEAALARGEHRPVWRPVVKNVAAGLGVQLPDAALEQLANYFAARRYDLRFRLRLLAWAAAWARDRGRVFRLYGRGWERIPELAPFAVGPVEHGEPLRQAYRSASIVLQAIPGGFLHQRTFEGLASGSLVIAPHASTSVAGRHFPDLDRVLFRSESDLRDRLDRFVEREDERAGVLDELRQVVLEKFTYRAVVADVVERINAYHAAHGNASRAARAGRRP